MHEGARYPVGILFERREGVDGRVRTDGYRPDPRLQRYVQAFWTMTWDLPPPLTHTSLVVPSGCVNLILGQEAPRVTGVKQEVLRYDLTGTGQAFGVLFTPGGFYPFHGQPVSLFTDGALPLAEAFGGAGLDLPACVRAAADVQAKCQIVSDFLLVGHPPAAEPDFDLVERLVAYVIDDEDVHTTAQIVARFGVNERRLQRLFDRFVGVGPKMLIRTKRFQTALKTLLGGGRVDLADLALRLGYHDQAHFNNDFKKMTGRSPTTPWSPISSS